MWRMICNFSTACDNRHKWTQMDTEMITKKYYEDYVSELKIGRKDFMER